MNRLRQRIKEARLFLEGAGSAAEMFEPALIEEHKRIAFKGRYKLIEMTIKDFLFLAKKGHSDDKAARVQGYLSANRKFDALPHLSMYSVKESPTHTEPFAVAKFKATDVMRVEGHEGRHRARALAALGYTTIPVVLHTDIRWSEQNNPDSRHDYRKKWPKEVEQQDGTGRLPFPVRREDAEKPYSGKVEDHV